MEAERSVKALLWAVVVIWGLNVVIIKFLVAHFAPVTLSAVRIGAAAVFLLALLSWKGGFRKLSLKSWIYICGAGLTSIVFHQMTLSTGLQTSNASTSSLILGLNPLATGILAYLLFREPMSWSRIIGVILGLCGVFTVVAGDSFLKHGSGQYHFGSGELLILIAMLLYVIGGLFVKKAAETVPVLVITAYMHVVGTVGLTVASFFEVHYKGGLVWPADWFFWAVLLFSGWVATGLCSFWWNNGISKIGAGRTAMFMNAQPIASLVFAVLLLGERVTWIHAVGFITVLGGIYLGTMSKRKTILPMQTTVAPTKRLVP